MMIGSSVYQMLIGSYVYQLLIGSSVHQMLIGSSVYQMLTGQQNVIRDINDKCVFEHLQNHTLVN